MLGPVLPSLKDFEHLEQAMTIRRIDPRGGYYAWADTYDATPNPVVRMDAGVTSRLIEPVAGERILGAGCGTGRNFPHLLEAGAEVTGMDFSTGMLRVARKRYPEVPLVQADMQQRWPFDDDTFDAVLNALVGEHLDDLDTMSREMARVLRSGGKAVFSVYHPAMSAAGKEAHFLKDDIEYRLGAVHHELADYQAAFERAGFVKIAATEHAGDEELAANIPNGKRYLGFPVLVVFRMEKS